MHEVVIPRAGGVSSTPRLLGSIIAVSGILDHPPSRVMTTECVSAFSRRIAPELFHQPCRPQQEGAGNAGCRLAPAVSCAMCTDKCAHEHTGTAGAARHSLRSGFTAYTALSPETNSFCLRRRRIEDLAKPGWVRNISAGLTPATGARTTRLCRPRSAPSSARGLRSQALSPPCENVLRARHCRGHRSPHPTSVTIAIRPSCGRGMAGVVGLIWVEREAEYFSRQGWTGFE
jgi:hypothetical protein